MGGLAVLGTGFAVPEREITNDALAARLDTSDAWIVSRTGIRARRVLDDPSIATSHLATAAARAALARARLEPDAIDLAIPIALAEACAAGHLHEGDVLGLTTAGAGLTWGAAILRWG